MYGYIYKTTNLVNGKIYVGQHKSNCFDAKYYGSGKILKQAISKFGIDSFICELIEWCETKEQIEEREIFWIAKYDSCNPNIGYNISEGGFVPRLLGKNHPMFGKHPSDASKEKNRIAHIGVKQSQETKDKRTKTLQRINKNKQLYKKLKWIDEHHLCEQCGSIMLEKYGSGRFCDKNCLRKHQASIMSNRKMSDTTREKLSQSHLGSCGYWKNKHRDEATRLKIHETLSAPRPNRMIQYRVDDKLFCGLIEGAEYFGVTKSCMSLWIKRGYTKTGKQIDIIIDNQLHRIH